MVKHFPQRMRSWKSSKGQIIILVALFAVALTGMVGLSIDLGYTFAEKRATQNAADAAVLAGAHDVTKWSATNSLQMADAGVATVVDENKMNSSTTMTYTCNYVDDTGKSQGACSTVVPGTATGVHIVVHEQHSTFFMRVVPFGPKTVSTSASASAHIQAVTSGLGGDSPFIVCGFDTKLSGGGTMSILNAGIGSAPPTNQLIGSILTYPVASSSQYHVQFLKKSTPTPTPTATSTATDTATGGGGDNATYSFNSLAYGQTFQLHGPQVADCGNKSDSFKGLSDPDDDFDKAIPGWFDTLTGDKAGTTRVRFNGINGCAVGTTDPNGCVLIVPIASTASNGQFYVVTIGAFFVTQSGANTHTGVLLKDYEIQVVGGGSWTGSNGWAVGDDGMVEVRLTP